MKILGIIPARGGSKGVPQKNIKMLGGKPLIAFSIESAQKSALLTQVVVSTDEEAIAHVAEKFNCKPPFIRPSALAQDASTSLEVVQHAVDFYEQQGVFFDAICLLQPTSPFREAGFIDLAIRTFIKKQADCLISVLPIPHEYNPHWAFEVIENGLLSIATGDKTIISRRQDLPKAYHRDGSIYITKTEVIKNGSFYGNSIACIESNPQMYVNIDTQEDWEKAQKLVIQFGL